MTPLAKSLLTASAIAAVVAGTLMIRPKPAPVAQAQLTPSQLAEVQPVAKPQPQPSVQNIPPPPPEDAQPEDPDFEDGNGS